MALGEKDAGWVFCAFKIVNKSKGLRLDSSNNRILQERPGCNCTICSGPENPIATTVFGQAFS